jgi:hypothetical protein
MEKRIGEEIKTPDDCREKCIVSRPERMLRIPVITKVVIGIAVPNVTITVHVRVPLGTRLLYVSPPIPLPFIYMK